MDIIELLQITSNVLKQVMIILFIILIIYAIILIMNRNSK